MLSVHIISPQLLRIIRELLLLLLLLLLLFFFLLLLLDADFVNNKTCTDEVTVVLTKLQMIYQSLEQSVFSNNELLSWHELLQ